MHRVRLPATMTRVTAAFAKRSSQIETDFRLRMSLCSLSIKLRLSSVIQ